MIYAASLRPGLAFGVSANQAQELGLGSGVNNSECGLQLRYEIMRVFARFFTNLNEEGEPS